MPLMALTAEARVLADFEDGTTGRLTIDTEKTIDGCFTAMPAVMDNPDKTGINASAKCFGAVNTAGADWWGNMVGLTLKTPVTIGDNNRILSFLCYRSIQPKEMRIGFNGYEKAEEVFCERMPAEGRWERVTIDLGESHYGETLTTIYIVFSCNWSEPRTGWGEATYCYDDFNMSAEQSIPPATVVIDPAIGYQTITDFGASDCWTADYIGRYFSETERSRAARQLFSMATDDSGNPEGIGLSCWRVNIGAGSATQGDDSNIGDETRRTECFLNEDGSYDWSRQAGQQYFMRQALNYGVDRFVLFSNSAPIYLTRNGKANAGNARTVCNLNAARFPDFAEFLATTAKHFADEGYNITRISPVNEPAFDWLEGQEGSPWRNSDIAGLARELDKSIASRGLATKILLPEASSLDLLYGGTGAASNQIEAFFNSANTSTFIGNLPSVAREVAGHSYWTFTTNADLRGVREKARDAAAKYGLNVAQTEWSMLDAAPKPSTGFPESYDAASYMDIALFMGKLIQCDLRFGDMSSWAYWTAFSCEQYSQKNRFYLMRIHPQSGDYGKLTEGGTVSDDKNLWVLGNYSRFIRPGYRRIQLDGACEMNHLLGSAYIAPDGKRIVAVFVNTAHGDRMVSINMLQTGADGLPMGAIESVDKYVTSTSLRLRRSTATESIQRMTIPARSVVTVVLSLGEYTGIKDISSATPALADSKAIYNISGLQMAVGSTLSPGLYICNGKKFAVSR